MRLTRPWRLRASTTRAAVHALVGLVAIDLAAWGSLRLLPGDPITASYGRRTVALVYPGRSAGDVRRLLAESWSRPAASDPSLAPREAPFQGRFVNVDRAGFRFSRGQGPWPPDPGRANVFVFGGSTAFGYGVSDDETIASEIQAFVDERIGRERVSCYNFGGRGFCEASERLLFQQLLARGVVPRVAVFVDGLNEFASEEPGESPATAAPGGPSASSLSPFVNLWPLSRLVTVCGAGSGECSGEAGQPCPLDDPALLDARIERYLANRRLIAAAAGGRGVRALFVWQPAPTYRYDPRWHLFGDVHRLRQDCSAAGYARMAGRARGGVLGPDFLWLADLQEGARMPLYVDAVHYTPLMSAWIGDEISLALLKGRMLP
ncbi:MAG TPA: hypothetical protein VEQ10_18080 [Vicinamibacteria bacterium]|nr:hypothetical protein [Vicinamibacteria bacterium]